MPSRDLAPGSFGYFLWQWYTRVRNNPPGRILDAIMYAVFAFGSLGHWSTYAFAFLFICEVGYIAAEQWYQWRFTIEVSDVGGYRVPDIYESPEFARYSTEINAGHDALQALCAFDMFLRLLHSTKDFESAVFAHHLTMPAVVSSGCPSPVVRAA